MFKFSTADFFHSLYDSLIKKTLVRGHAASVIIKLKKQTRQKLAADRMAPLVSIREVSDSNLYPGAGYPD
jgi:hypothetical protein